MNLMQMVSNLEYFDVVILFW